MMSKTVILATVGVALLSGHGLTLTQTQADEVRFVKRDGVTYRETYRIVREPVAQVQVREQHSTVYREQYTTEMRDSVRTVYRPVVEYRWEPRVHGWWNPFRNPHVAYHYVPAMRWEAESQRLRTPVTYRQLVPETRIVQVPDRSLSFVEREELVSRVAVAPNAPSPLTPVSQPATSIARGIGGIRQMQSDPPRQGTTILR